MPFLKPKCTNQSHCVCVCSFIEPYLNFKMYNELDKLSSEQATNSVFLFMKSLLEKFFKFCFVLFCFVLFERGEVQVSEGQRHKERGRERREAYPKQGSSSPDEGLMNREIVT